MGGRNIRHSRTAKGLDREIWLKIIECFSQAGSPEKTEKLFLDLLTEQERETVARRLCIISLVRAGKSYSEIGAKLWVSPATISAIKKCLLVNRGYKSRREFDMTKEIQKLVSKKVSLPKEESRFERMLDYIAFTIEHTPQKGGSRWTTLDYSWTAPLGYWHKKKK